MAAKPLDLLALDLQWLSDLSLAREGKFPEEYLIRYNLACYARQLGNLKEAREWLKKASALAGTKQIKLMALEDGWLKMGTKPQIQLIQPLVSR